MEMIVREIIGIPPAADLQVKELSSNFALLTFTSSPVDALSWIYRWPVTGDNFQHMPISSFLDESIRHLSDKKYIMFANYKFAYPNNKHTDLYSAVCLIKMGKEPYVHCEIKVTKL
jgi:hypothetical protein